VITSGANGIGRRIAKTFLRGGTTVSVIEIDKETGKKFDEIEFYYNEIADKTALDAFVSYLKQPVEYLINNACIGRGGILSNYSYEDFEYIQRVGVTAPYYLTSLLLKTIYLP